MIKLTKLYNRDKGVCNYCKRNISLEDSTRDHVVAKCNGGSSEQDNLVLCCKECNHSKNGASIELWLKRRDPKHISEEVKELLRNKLSTPASMKE